MDWSYSVLYTISIFNCFFLVLKKFLWARVHLFIGAYFDVYRRYIVEMVQDKVVTHSSSQRCTETSETRTPNTTPTSTERPSNVCSQRWSESSRDSHVLYWDTLGMCVKFMHMQNLWVCVNIYICFKSCSLILLSFISIFLCRDMA